MFESIYLVESSDFYSLICNFAIYYTLISILLYLLIEVDPNEIASTKENTKSTTSELSCSSSDEDYSDHESRDDDEVLLSGSIYVKSTSIRIGKGWRLRYFRMKRHELSYFKDEDEASKWCGSIMLNSTTIVDKLNPNQCYGKHNGMTIRTDANAIVCYFLFPHDRDKWINSLRKHILSLREEHRPVSMSPTSHLENDIPLNQVNIADADKKRPLSTFRRMKMAVFNRKESDSYDENDGITVSPKQSSSDVINAKSNRPTSTAVELLESSGHNRVTSTSIVSMDETVASSTTLTSNTADDHDHHHETNAEITPAKKKRFSHAFRMFSGNPSSSEGDSHISTSTTTPIGVALNPMVPDEDPTKYHRFLLEGETIIESALTIKKNPIGIPHHRQLILTSSPRLIYVDPKDMVLKGEVKWMDNMHKRVDKVNETTFRIDVDSRQYKFIDAHHGAQYWVDLIRKIALQHPEVRARAASHAEAYAL
jgi:hypothetical protein